MKTFLSPLTPEEEKECIERMKEGDLKAKHQLIEHNLRLVAHVAKKYQASDEDMEDLISKAMNQNFVPVIDDKHIFIGIVTRKDIIEFCYNEYTKKE